MLLANLWQAQDGSHLLPYFSSSQNDVSQYLIKKKYLNSTSNCLDKINSEILNEPDLIAAIVGRTVDFFLDLFSASTVDMQFFGWLPALWL